MAGLKIAGQVSVLYCSSLRPDAAGGADAVGRAAEPLEVLQSQSRDQRITRGNERERKGEKEMKGSIKRERRSGQRVKGRGRNFTTRGGSMGNS